MKFCIGYHHKDPAAANIITQLKKLGMSAPIYCFDKGEHVIYLDGLDKEVKEDFIIFTTTHRSTQHNKTLTVHCPGNFNGAKMGGQERAISPGSALVNKNLFCELVRQAAGSEYVCTLEATHHGPLLSKPSCFIEIGSSEEEWKDARAGEIIAKTLFEFLSKDLKKDFTPAVAIGATHYCPSFSKVQLYTKYAIAHVLANYNMPFEERMILEMVEKTIEKPKVVIVDWKGVGRADERDRLVEMLKGIGLEVVRTDKIEG